MSVRGMAFILKGPAGSVRPHRCALTQERSGAAAAVDAVPSSDHTQRGCSAPLLPHQHHDTQIQTRNLSRTEDQPAEDCVDTYPHIHTRTLARSHARRGEHRSDPQPNTQRRNRSRPRRRTPLRRGFCAFRSRNASPHGHPAGEEQLPASRFTQQHVIVGQGRQQRALRQLCGTVPPGEDAGQRTDRLVRVLLLAGRAGLLRGCCGEMPDKCGCLWRMRLC